LDKYLTGENILYCQYCNRPAKSQNSNTQHKLRCKSNPDGIVVKPSYGMLGKKGANQYTYGAVVSPETRQKISKATTLQNIKRWSDPENKIKHSIAMKKAVENNPESYTSSNRGRTKQIIVDGIKFQGQWEVDFYLWARENGLEPTRPNKSFTYEWNGTRTYFPDFYIKSKDLYVEVKGYETDRDRAKWLHFPGKLRIIKEAEIKQIRQGCFVGL
jgi:hypothetical protein